MPNGSVNANAVQHDFVHHVISLAQVLASSVVPLHSLGQDNGNEVQQDISGHVTPLERE